jgi:hypothetical protein
VRFFWPRTERSLALAKQVWDACLQGGGEFDDYYGNADAESPVEYPFEDGIPVFTALCPRSQDPFADMLSLGRVVQEACGRPVLWRGVHPGGDPGYVVFEYALADTSLRPEAPDEDAVEASREYGEPVFPE